MGHHGRQSKPIPFDNGFYQSLPSRPFKVTIFELQLCDVGTRDVMN